MKKREKFIAQMVELEKIIVANNAKGVKTGPITMGMYLRLKKVFK